MIIFLLLFYFFIYPLAVLGGLFILDTLWQREVKLPND